MIEEYISNFGRFSEEAVEPDVIVIEDEEVQHDSIVVRDKEIQPDHIDVRSENRHPDKTPTAAFYRPPSIADFTSLLLGNDMAQRRRDYIIQEVQDIFNKISLFETPKDVHACRGKILEALDLLRAMFGVIKSCESIFGGFEKFVRHILDLAEAFTANTAIVEAGAEIDVEHINSLTREHGACCATIKQLNVQLNDLVKEIKDVDATEVDVIAAERQAQEAMKRAQAMRHQFDSTKTSLLLRKINLETSLDEENLHDLALQQARADAQEHRLGDIREAAKSCLLNEIEIRQLIKKFVSRL